MREVLSELLSWWEAGETVGMGTVVATWKSAPRPAGASMLVGPDDSAVGSVSGGCVEGAVYELSQSVVASGTPTSNRSTASASPSSGRSPPISPPSGRWRSRRSSSIPTPPGWGAD